MSENQISKYRIEKNEKFGRFMVAATEIKAGETILTEFPVLLGSQVGGPLSCFNCFRNIGKNKSAICKHCEAALLCSSSCIGKFHNLHECRTLKDCKIIGQFLLDNEQVIFPLRCILLKKYKPAIWEKIFALEHHCEQRKGTAIWRRNILSVDTAIRKLQVISNEEDAEDIIQRICGIIDVNTFEIRPPNQDIIIRNPEVECLRGLYLNAALMAHDCIGNTFLSVDDDFSLTVKASVNISEKSPIYFNYANPLSGTDERKEHLRVGKYFTCTCSRCSDATELGTHLSSLKCHSCNNGYIISSNPQNEKSHWQCTSCEKTFLYSLVKTTTEVARRIIQETDQFDPVKLDLLLKKLHITFHPNHYLLLEIKQSLIGLYARMPPAKRNLLYKIKLCREVLDVVSKIEPGISRTKAMTLYQLQSAQIDLANKMHRNGEIKMDELLSALGDAESTLKEAVRYLLYEPIKSPERKIAQMAMSELKMLRLSMENISRLTNMGITEKSKVSETSKPLDKSEILTSEKKRKNRKK